MAILRLLRMIIALTLMVFVLMPVELIIFVMDILSDVVGVVERKAVRFAHFLIKWSK